MATDAQSLLAQAACYECFTANPYMAQLAQLALLRQIVLNQNAMAAVDAQSLLDQSKCYSCYASNPYMLKLMELALLAQVVANGSTGGGGGGSGSGSVLCGAANPVAAPTTSCGVYVKQNGALSGIWVWDGAAWRQLI
jgi:hypothetical protein